MKINKLLLLVVLAFSGVQSSIAQNCQTIDTHETTGWVLPAGKYCLNVDIKQPELFDSHSMRFKTFSGAGLLSIISGEGEVDQHSARSPRLEIDLRNHTLEARPKNMVGVRDNVQSERVYLHNGSIIVPGTKEPNVGIDLQSLQSPRTAYARSTCARSDSSCGGGSASDGKAPTYRQTEHVVEKVDVRAGWLGVQMVGIGNTIRDSVIEVDSRGAIALFGPGSKIENNTIIVHGKGDPTPEDGAIVLWDGNGAVIRNNRFIFKGWLKKAPPGIRLIDSADVQLEGNTFEGFAVQVEQVGASSHRADR